MILIADLHIRVIDAETGELIRQLTLDPSKNYQPLGRPPGPPPPAANHGARRRGQGWPQATPRAPGLDPVEDDVALAALDGAEMHDVPRRLSTVSRDITLCSGGSVLVQDIPDRCLTTSGHHVSEAPPV
jgi:hypothetical protein